jgi:hypothetical protein
MKFRQLCEELLNKKGVKVITPMLKTESKPIQKPNFPSAMKLENSVVRSI